MLYDFANTTHLIGHFQALSGVDLTELMDDWFYGQGFPIYTLTANQSAHNVKIQLDQRTAHPAVDFFEMPVEIRVFGGGLKKIFFSTTPPTDSNLKSNLLK